MSSKSFENYSLLACEQSVDNIEVAGRYRFQDEAERRIVPDVMHKLALDAGDSLIEIGCGPGNLLLPLSYLVKESAGIDNAVALNRLRSRCGADSRIELLAGDFLSMALPDRRYSKVLVYSVLQYLDTAETAVAFLRRCLHLVAPGGRVLIGDLPNRDKKRRYMDSPAGALASHEWQKVVAAAGQHPMTLFPEDPQLVRVDDQLVIGLLLAGREIGFESYVLGQPDGLPFSKSREDLLFVAPK